jgi:hypothetical protein
MANATATSNTMMLEERVSLLQHAATVAIILSQVLKTNPAVAIPYKFHTLEIPPGVFPWWKCNNSAPTR